MLVRRDPVPTKFKPELEGCLGRVSDFAPQTKNPCMWCEGLGYDKVSNGPCNADWEAVTCTRCGGTGVKPRRPRRPRERP